MKSPKLRTVDKFRAPYPLGKFPKDFAYKIGEEIVFKIATQQNPNLEGSEWEYVFSKALGAQWKPSNVGLDDIIIGAFAWGAKTIKSAHPFSQKTVRLISGRNSPKYSYSVNDTSDARKTWPLILGIWNARVGSLKQKYSELRTVVLMRSNTLDEFCIFEFETVIYPTENFRWAWNINDNLEGFDLQTDKHCFTWQPHGSQFTIIEDVPPNKLCFRLKTPTFLDTKAIIKTIGYDKTWIQIVNSTDE